MIVRYYIYIYPYFYKKGTFAGFHAFKISVSRQRFKVVSILQLGHIDQNDV